MKMTIADAMGQIMLCLFPGRLDRYSMKNINRATGKKVFYPVCANFWRVGKCLKRINKEAGIGGKSLCKLCKFPAYVPLDKFKVWIHLKGGISIGTVPISKNVVSVSMTDFDNHEESDLPVEQQPMILAAGMADAAALYGIHMRIEKSGGGAGSHCWIFYSEPVPAHKARELQSGLLHSAGVGANSDIEIFPKQNTVEEGGYGSVTAWPLQGPEVMQKGWSMFYSPNLEPLVEYDTRETFETNMVRIYHMLRSFYRQRTTPEGLDAALVKLRKEGHLPHSPSKRPQAHVQSHVPNGERERDADSYELLQDPIKAVFRHCEALALIRDKAQGRIATSVRHQLRHMERLFLGSVLKDLPEGRYQVHRLVSHCSDYDSGRTDGHLDSLSGAPMRCAKAQTPFLGITLCPYKGPCLSLKKRWAWWTHEDIDKGVKGRGPYSPVTFAYKRHSRPTKPQRGVEWRSSEPADLDRVKKIMETIG